MYIIQYIYTKNAKHSWVKCVHQHPHVTGFSSPSQSSMNPTSFPAENKVWMRALA